MFLVDWFYGILASLGELPIHAGFSVCVRNVQQELSPEFLFSRPAVTPFSLTLPSCSLLQRRIGKPGIPATWNTTTY